MGIWQLGYATANSCRVGSGSVGAQTGRLGLDRGPLAVKIELVWSQGSHSLRFTAAGGLMHRGPLSVHFFRLHETVTFPGRVPLRRFDILAESPDYAILDWPNRESLA